MTSQTPQSSECMTKADWLRSEIEKFDDVTDVIKSAVALVQLLESDKKLNEADYELYGYGEACATIKVHGEKSISIITRYKEELKVLESK